MKKLLLGLLVLGSFSAFSQVYETVKTQSSQMEIIDNGDRVTVNYPVSKYLDRESASDVVYFGSRAKANNVCAKLNFGSYVRGSKIIIKTRAISTNNITVNQIAYRVNPMNRLSENYKYPKTKIYKSITCYKID